MKWSKMNKRYENLKAAFEIPIYMIQDHGYHVTVANIKNSVTADSHVSISGVIKNAVFF